MIGDITGVTAGTGLNGGGSTGDVTLNINVPLNLAGTISATSSYTGISGTASAYNGRGIYGEATGATGSAVYGFASNSGEGHNFGGYFRADGETGMGVSGFASGASGWGVCGAASNTGDVRNYGGYFSAAGDAGLGVYGHAAGDSGRGVKGFADGADGVGVEGIASGNTGRGVYGKATGDYGRGIFGEATKTGDAQNFGGYFLAAGGEGRGIYSYATATGATQNYGGYFKANGDTGRGVYGHATGATGRGVKGFASGSSGVGVDGVSTHGVGVRGNGATYDFYAAGSGKTNFGPFTGGHDVCLRTSLDSEIKPGMIVSVSGQVEKRLTENGEVSLSSTLPTVILADQAQDKAIFGVLVSENSFPDDHWYKAQDDERLGIVNALGEGCMWVSNINGDIEVGDYITSSNVPGYGQLQDDDFIHSYTVGKAIETVDWETVTESITDNGEQIKVYLIAVVYTCG